MGNVGSVLLDAGVKAAGDMLSGVGGFLTRDDAGYGLVRSINALMQKSESGKVMSDFLQHEFEPSARKYSQELFNDKVNKGIAPHIAAIDAAKEGWTTTRKKAFGNKDEAIIKYIQNVRNEKGVIHANAMADAMGIYLHDTSQAWRRTKITPESKPLYKIGIRKSSNFQNVTDWEKSLNRSLSIMFTPLIAIPHTSQLANVMLDNATNPKVVLQGLGEYLSSVSRKELQAQVIKSGALFDDIRFQALENAGGGSIARKLFNHPGFNWVRQQEINIAAAVGKHAAMDAVDKLNKDVTDKYALYTLAKLGINPKKVIESGRKLSEDDILKAMYAEADRTIFLRSNLHTPWKWEESFIARAGAMYRHFAYRQGKFLSEAFKDSYKTSGSKGLAASIGTFAVLFPAFGELVHSAENIATAKNPFSRDKTGSDEYFDAIGHAAGFGIFYSMMRAAQFNGGKGFLSGPLFSTAEDLTFGMYNALSAASRHQAEGDTDKRNKDLRRAARIVTSKGGIPGRIATQVLREEDKK